MRKKILSNFQQGLSKAYSVIQKKYANFRDRRPKDAEINSKRPESSERVPLSGEAVNLEDLQDQERESSVTFYATENSEISKGAEKTEAKGIDSFGERDTFDFDEADDYQTDRDRKQNSDLADRFPTKGL